MQAADGHHMIEAGILEWCGEDAPPRGAAIEAGLPQTQIDHADRTFADIKAAIAAAGLGQTLRQRSVAEADPVHPCREGRR